MSKSSNSLPQLPCFGSPPVSTCHHGRLAALVHSCARGTTAVRTSNPGEPLQPGNPGYPASPCQTDKAGVSMSGAHGKTPSIIPEPQKGHPSPVPGWKMNGPAEREPHCPMWDTAFIPAPHNGFGWAKARVLRLNSLPQSRDLPSCHQCHQCHACLSHPERENRDHEEGISKDPSTPRCQSERINCSKAEADLGSFGSSRALQREREIC